MLVGVFADAHDHVDHMRLAVEFFRRARCELALYAGDFTSTFITPSLRRLPCPFIGVFGDNDGNKRGLRNGVSLVGAIHEPPIGVRTADGRRVLLTHMLRDCRGLGDGAEIVIYAHTHKPRVERDVHGRLLVNPGELSGWTYRAPTVALVDTTKLDARIISLPQMASYPVDDALHAMALASRDFGVHA